MELLKIIWTVEPDIISSPLTIRWYGLLFASAFLLGYYVLQHIFKKEGVPEEWLDKVLLYVMVGTVVGARLGHVFFYDWAYYSQNLMEIPQVWKGGLASHGAAIGIILALWLFSRKVTKKPILWILDRVVITVALGGFFIRLGNLMNHEIIGKPADVPWAFVFTRIDNIPRHPSQLYEALCYLVIFGVLFFLWKKKEWGRVNGKLFGLFLVLLFSVRFMIEFVKENQSAFEQDLPLNMGQILSIPFVLFGLGLLFVKQKKAE